MSLAPVLTFVKDGETVESVEIKDDVIVGRGEGCGVRLDDRAVSRQHAVFKIIENGAVSVSKRSAFGELKINGADVNDAVLKEGDLIHLGPYLVRLQAKKEKTASLVEPVATVIPAEPRTFESFDPESIKADVIPVPPAPPEPITDVPLGVDPLGLDQAETPIVNPTVSDAPPTDLDGVAPPQSVDLNVMTAPEPVADTTDLAELSPDEETRVAKDSHLKVALILPEGSANVTEFVIDKDEVVIGRSKREGCDIILNDKKTSKRHAIIRRSGPHYLIKNLSDTNGTFVNGTKIDEQELSGEDVIKIADVEIKFKADDQKYSEQEPGFLQVPLEEPPPLAQPAPVPEQEPIPQHTGAQDPGLQALPGFAPPPTYQSNYQTVPPAFVPKAKPTSLVEKFRAMPPLKRMIWVLGLGMIIYLYLDEEPTKPVPKPQPSMAPKVAAKGVLTYDDLTPDQKRFVETQHTLAFDHYKNRDYDKALYEVRKIFTLIGDYKDSREIERYALEGQQKLKALEDEKKRKEDEEKLKLKIAGLVEEADKLMRAKNYAKVRDLFAEIRLLDPENPRIAAWIKEIESHDEELRQKEAAKATEKENNARTWDHFNEGMALKKKGQYYAAIDVFKTIPDYRASDTRVEVKAKQMIGACYAAIKAGRDPFLAEAKQAEDSGELSKAFQLYKKASLVDPRHPDAYKGMNRIRGVLHDRAKALYTEAVLAESYSDFALAQKRYKEVLEVAPEDDVYHGRATRKLRMYVGQKFEGG